MWRFPCSLHSHVGSPIAFTIEPRMVIKCWSHHMVQSLLNTCLSGFRCFWNLHILTLYSNTCVWWTLVIELGKYTLSCKAPARRATLNICIWCHQLYLSCSILIVHHPCNVANTKCKPNIICHSLEYNLGIRGLWCQFLSLTLWFFVQISIIHDNMLRHRKYQNLFQ